MDSGPVRPCHTSSLQMFSVGPLKPQMRTIIIEINLCQTCFLLDFNACTKAPLVADFSNWLRLSSQYFKKNRGTSVNLNEMIWFNEVIWFDAQLHSSSSSLHIFSLSWMLWVAVVRTSPALKHCFSVRTTCVLVFRCCNWYHIHSLPPSNTPFFPPLAEKRCVVKEWNSSLEHVHTDRQSSDWRIGPLPVPVWWRWSQRLFHMSSCMPGCQWNK